MAVRRANHYTKQVVTFTLLYQLNRQCLGKIGSQLQTEPKPYADFFTILENFLPCSGENIVQLEDIVADVNEKLKTNSAA